MHFKRFGRVKTLAWATLILGLVFGLSNCDQIPVPTYKAPVLPDSAAVPAGYNLVWHDEFQLDGHPDSSKWDYATGLNYMGWGNAEQEFYTSNQLRNAEVSGGVLHIRAQIEHTSEVVYGKTYQYEYTSARLVTYGKASWTYGFYEIRAKIPGGLGTWPAIWTLGTGLRWPEDGEIDLMEQWGNAQNTMGTFHVTNNNQTSGYAFPSDIFGTFHNYQMLWTPTYITLLVDGVVINTWTKYTSITDPVASYAQWPFDKPEYLVLNLAIGGNNNQTVDRSIFPRDFQVDYVRIYQKN